MSGSAILRRETRVPEGRNRLTLIIPVRYDGFIHLLLWAWLLAWGFMEIALIVSVLHALRGGSPHPTQSGGVLALLLGFFTVAGAFMAWRLLWVSRGREILDLTPARVTLQREPGGGPAEEFDRSQIKDLHIGSYARNAVYPSWGRRFIGKEEAYIAFDYEGKTHEIARGISRHDAEYVLGLLRG